jgi:NADPH2:quinone reductase
LGDLLRAIQITEFGGPEVLTLAEVDDPTPVGPMALIDVRTAGINYADTHQAENSYLAAQQLPLIPGAEIAGTTADGRRVVALLASGGGYAEKALAHPSVTFDLPDRVDDLTALALVLQGTTAWHRQRTCAPLSGGERVVDHSAAGGVGSLAVQLARAWGAGRVIATASTDAKRQQALDLGAQVAVDVSALDADGVRDGLVAANDGQEVDIVLEMTGGPVFDGSLAALAPLGRLVTYGLASRTAPTPVPATALMATSRAVIGFWLVHSLRRPGGLGPPMEELLSLAASGGLVAVDGGHYPLAEARRAHEDIRSRRTTGKLVLDVRR